MKTFIILLRGINVGGHRKMPMAQLRDLLTGTGFHNVKTYIQSGNIVLQSDKNLENIKLLIEQVIPRHFGFAVLTQVKTYQSLKKIYNQCPFYNDEKQNSYFIMLDTSPNKLGLEEVKNLKYKGEKFTITEDCIYFYSTYGYGRTKFNSNFFEKKLKVNATSRNYKTMLRLLAMAEELEAKL